ASRSQAPTMRRLPIMRTPTAIRTTGTLLTGTLATHIPAEFSSAEPSARIITTIGDDDLARSSQAAGLAWAGLGRRAQVLEQHDERHIEYRNGYRQRHHACVVGNEEVDLARRAVGVVILARIALEHGKRAPGK